MDRSAINRALAKALAYRQVGNDVEVERWARELVRLLEVEDILMPTEVVTSGRY